MHYLTVMADYTGSALRDDFGGPVEPEALGLDASTAAAIREWNQRYRVVIPLGQRERAAPENESIVATLDREGLALADRVAAALADGSKVRYYSEGLLRHLR
jgi:hypothetical protein